MFDTIPVDVEETLENNDLLVYSTRITLSKHGPVLHIGAMFPYVKNRWEPLDEEENRELRMDVKKELRKLGYRAKVRSFAHPRSGERDVNDFRIKVLLQEGEDIDQEIVDRLRKIKRQLRRAKKRAAQRARLSGQL